MVNIFRLLILMRSINTKIRNNDLPVCVNCRYFIEHTNNYPYDALPNDLLYGKCKKFGEINCVTGVLKYDFAKNCRTDNDKCGKIGIEYMSKITNNP